MKWISPFLTPDEGVWWTRTEDGFLFCDGDEDSCTREDGFTLLHFHHHSIVNMEKWRKIYWKKIVEERIALPANRIKVYDQGEKRTGWLVYHSGSVTFECHGNSAAEFEEFSSDLSVSIVPNSILLSEVPASSTSVDHVSPASCL